MSAIALVFWFDERDAQTNDVEPMIDAMANRAPDGKHTWTDGSVAFALGALHGTPESPRARYPVRSQNDRYLILWDGRIDNRYELLRWLETRGICLSPDAPDAQIVVETFVACGEATTLKIRGDFAFAVLDRQQKQLFCARDKVGARPFYWAKTDKFFALASEDKPLTFLEKIGDSQNLDRQIYASNPWFSAFDWEISWFANVRILMPATSLRVERNGEIVKRRYFEFEPSERAKYANDGEVVDAFAEVFERAVAQRSGGLREIGVIASGGIDSAVVALAASRVADGRVVKQFSTLQDDPRQCVESQAILALHKTLNTELHALRVPSMTGVVSQRDVNEFYSTSHPVDDSISLVGMMCLASRRAGQRVLLHGASGDLAFHSPDDYLLLVARERGIRAVVHEANLARRHHTYRVGQSVTFQLIRSLYTYGTSPAFKRAWRKLREHRTVVLPKSFVGSRADLEKLKLSITSRQDQAMHDIDCKIAGAADKLSAERLSALFPVGLVRGLEGYERVAGRFGVELRDPLGAAEVITFANTLPLEWLVGEGWTKRLLRAYADRRLPNVSVWRSDKLHLGALVRAK